MKKKVWFLILWIVLFLGNPLFSQNDQEKTLKAEETFEQLLQKELEKPTNLTPERPSWVWQFTKTTLVLSFFLAFFWAIYKIYLFKKNLPISKAQAFRVIYSYPLAPGKFLQVVEIPNRFLILGVSESGIQLIREVQDRAEMELIRLECEKDRSEPKVDFLTELGKQISKRAREFFKIKTARSNFSETQTELYWQDIRKQSQLRLEKLREQKENLREKSHE